MSTKFHQTTAKIYEFRTRFTPAGLRRVEEKVPGADRVTIEAGSGWYHEAAIRDADRSRKP